GWTGLLGIDRADRHGWQVASQPTRSMEGDGLGRHREGDGAGRPLRLAREFNGECPQGARRLHLSPSIALDGAWNEGPIPLAANHKLGPLPWLPRHRVYQPLLDIPCAIGHIHHQGRRTGLLDLAGALIPFQPAITLFFCNGFAFALLGHGLLWPLPDF